MKKQKSKINDFCKMEWGKNNKIMKMNRDQLIFRIWLERSNGIIGLLVGMIIGIVIGICLK